MVIPRYQKTLKWTEPKEQISGWDAYDTENLSLEHPTSMKPENRGGSITLNDYTNIQITTVNPELPQPPQTGPSSHEYTECVARKLDHFSRRECIGQQYGIGGGQPGPIRATILTNGETYYVLTYHKNSAVRGALDTNGAQRRLHEQIAETMRLRYYIAP